MSQQQLPKLKESAMNAFTSDALSKIQSFCNELNIKLNETVKQRLVSGAREAYATIIANGYNPYQFNINNLLSTFQAVAFYPVNPNAMPKQAYFKIQKIKGEPTLVYELQGSGWDRMLKSYGEDVQAFVCHVIREGDYFSGIEYNGFDIVQPKFKFLNQDEIVAKGLHKGIRKVKQVVYGIRTTSGDIWKVVNRDDVLANIIAQAKNNGAPTEIQREMASYSVDEILDPKGKWLEMTFKNSYGNTVNLLSPSYRDESSREGMLITKMKKYVCTHYPMDFDRDPDVKGQSVILQRVYQNSLEEDRYLEESISVEEVIENDKKDFDSNANKENIYVGEELSYKDESDEENGEHEPTEIDEVVEQLNIEEPNVEEETTQETPPTMTPDEDLFSQKQEPQEKKVEKKSVKEPRKEKVETPEWF